MSNNKYYLYLFVLLIASASGLLYPAISSTFGPYYGSIAKHIVVTGNWNDLVLSQKDWLDKPHLPFWLIACSFKLFGISGFSFAISGFIFNLIGAIYTFKLANLLYNKEVAKISLLLYLSTLHLMLSAIDVRAEAYLVGEIIASCYYSMLYYRYNKIKDLLLSAVFIALALMTKGLYTLITICSGMVCLWIYKKDWKRFIDYRWFLIVIIGLLLTFPEILALYRQFDIHPEKVVFGQNNVSGIKWFIFDSQFGRFFNTGPIISTNPEPFHWLYFVHTFLWAYLPWWPIFFLSVFIQCKKYKAFTENNVYLFASFFTTFILFSLTTFQVDHYTNIIFPFASIICANYLISNPSNSLKYPMNIISLVFLSIIILLLIILPIYIIILYIIVLLILLYSHKFNQDIVDKIIYLPIVLISILFSMIMFINGNIYAKYDASYQSALYLNNFRDINIIGYKLDNKFSIDLYSINNYTPISDDSKLDKNYKGYIFTKEELYYPLHLFYKNSFILKNFYDCAIDKVIISKITRTDNFHDCQKYSIIKVD